MSLQEPGQVIEQIRKVIAKRVRHPAGALFTFVLRHTIKGDFTIGGYVRFADEQMPARPSIRHSKMTLLEEWVVGTDTALERLQELLGGLGYVSEAKVPGKASYTSVEASGRWYRSEAGWKEWYFKSSLPRTENLGENELPSEPLVTPHAPPFVNGAHAVQEWLYRARDAWKAERSSAPWEILTVVSDARIRIVRTEWIQARLNVELEVNVPEQEYQVQVIYGGSSVRRHDALTARPGKLEFEVPEDAEAIKVFLVDSAGELLAQDDVARSPDSVPTKKVDVSEEERTKAELLAGESSQVEFKPFVEPKDQKEAELIKTVVAFSNTEGGRLYIGVDDGGVPQGFAELKKATKRTDDNVDLHLKVLVDRLDSLVRNNVKPSPHYDIKVHDKEGRPVVIVRVKKGDQPPYANLQNEYFVRHGSSSMRPDPSEMRRLSRSPGTDFALIHTLLGNR